MKAHQIGTQGIAQIDAHSRSDAVSGISAAGSSFDIASAKHSSVDRMTHGLRLRAASSDEVPGKRAGIKRLSVIIANHNYEQFLPMAIKSALNLRWDDIEVIVVDDGSTDGSRAVIEGFGDQVRALLTENASQRVAANRGYAMSTGDMVVFLDSDDVLPPDLPSQLARAWSPSVSKVQFQMQRIDERGQSIGLPFPRYCPVPTSDDIRRWMTTTSAYPTPPGSGNAYARWFLDQIFPLQPELGDASDSACLAAAPLLGEVVSVPGVVVGYRQHSGNDSDLIKNDLRFPREVARARARWRFAWHAAGEPADQVDERPLFRSRELLQLRIASRRVAPRMRPLPNDSWARMLLDSLRSPFHTGPESSGRRVLIAAWCLAMLVAPSPVARRLLTARYGRRG